MDTFLERVTFYDLYGYTVPGSFFLLMIISPYFSDILRILEKYEKIGIYIFALVILLSFIFGILISEISHYLFYKYLNIRKIRFSHLHIANLGIPERKLLHALIRAGLCSMDRRSALDILPKAIPYIYSDIQSDTTYNRIHNYASCEVLYRNLALALAGTLVLTIMQSGVSRQTAVSCLLFGISTWLMLRRAYRFMVKKEQYAVYWFVEKYSKRY